MRELVVYTTPGCGPCNALKLAIARHQLLHKFDVRYVMASPKTQNEFREAGVLSAPTTLCLEDDTIIGRFSGAKTFEGLGAQLEAWGLLEVVRQ